MNPTAIYGFLAHSIILGAFVALLPIGGTQRTLGLIAIPVALGAGVASFMHGVIGTPSLTLLALAICQLARGTASPLSYRAALTLLTFAIPFYAMALGVGPFDPYALGYQPFSMLVASIPLAAMLWWHRLGCWLLILALDLAGYASGLFANLWDVLFDPLLVLVALASVVRQHLQVHTLSAVDFQVTLAQWSARPNKLGGSHSRSTKVKSIRRNQETNSVRERSPATTRQGRGISRPRQCLPSPAGHLRSNLQSARFTLQPPHLCGQADLLASRNHAQSGTPLKTDMAGGNPGAVKRIGYRMQIRALNASSVSQCRNKVVLYERYACLVGHHYSSCALTCCHVDQLS